MQLTLKAEVGEESNVLSALLTLRQGGENEEPPPSLALSHADTLQADCETVEVTLGHIPPLHDPPGAEMLEGEVDDRGDNAHGEHPLGDRKVDGGIYRGRPVIESEEVDGDEDIDAVDGYGYEQQKPEIAVRERREAAC